jgi:hypothetical protein
MTVVRYALSFSRHDLPEGLHCVGPLKIRERGEDRVRAAPAVSCACLQTTPEPASREREDSCAPLQSSRRYCWGYPVQFGAADAQQADSCKICRNQQFACIKNYAGPTCKTEYQMCMKSCKPK